MISYIMKILETGVKHIEKVKVALKHIKGGVEYTFTDGRTDRIYKIVIIECYQQEDAFTKESVTKGRQT